MIAQPPQDSSNNFEYVNPIIGFIKATLCYFVAVPCIAVAFFSNANNKDASCHFSDGISLTLWCKVMLLIYCCMLVRIVVQMAVLKFVKKDLTCFFLVYVVYVEWLVTIFWSGYGIVILTSNDVYQCIYDNDKVTELVIDAGILIICSLPIILGFFAF